MISIFPDLNLQPVNFVANFSKSGAISVAEGVIVPHLHSNIWHGYSSSNNHTATYYTKDGVFDPTTSVIYADQHGTPLVRGHISSYSSSSPITIASGHYHMTIPSWFGNFNEPVIANSTEKLNYVHAGWLSQQHSWASGPYIPPSNGAYTNSWKNTFVTVFGNHSQFDLCSKLSLNEFNGISLRDPDSTHFDENHGTMWFTLCHQQSNGDHIAWSVQHNDDRVLGNYGGIKWISGLNDTIRAKHDWGASSATVPPIPQTQKSVKWYGNNASATSTGGSTIWVFQDIITTHGHSSWEQGHYMDLGSYGPDMTWLTRYSPIYESSTPASQGGNNQNNDVFPQSGWYGRSNGAGMKLYFNQRIRHWTNTKTD